MIVTQLQDRRLYESEVSKTWGESSVKLIADSSGTAMIHIPLWDEDGTFSNIYPQVVRSCSGNSRFV